MDGVFDAASGVVQPGAKYTYEFDAEPFSVHLYHCHTAPLAKHISKGLYGAFIIDPKQGRPRADREFIMVMSGYEVDFDGKNDFYVVNGIPFHYDHDKNPIRIKAGELVRIYLVNVLEFDPVNSFHLHAHFFHYYPTGTSLTSSEFTDTIALMQGQRGSSLALLGLIGGGPAIVGAWVGGVVYSQPLSVLFLAVGAGAVFQVAYEISRQMIWKEMAKRHIRVTVFAGVLTGMLTLYVTGVAVK
jgi:Multicopper oxidase